MRYDNVTFEDDKIILKRYGHTEGPEVYPYFDVGFDLKVTSDTPDVVEMVAKDGTYAYTLTRGCTPPPGTVADCTVPFSRSGSQLRSSAPRGRQLRSSAPEGRQPNGMYQVFGPNFNTVSVRADSSTKYGYTYLYDATKRPSSFQYQSGYSGYKLEEGSSGEIFKFNNPYVKVTSQFVKIPAEFVYDSTRNVVSFVPNNKSLPHIDAPLQQ
ncbi:hypothetical protein FOZ62_015222 [Perkinsus olseni]|uniref:Uncharacterized protein n=1 Tax=Perkinsus olseni TaxID=32597 RepID=A0A7J6TI01_PEROL|nr:hypothetical protein FOZ62_015222 [Perkinsus olseni]